MIKLLAALILTSSIFAAAGDPLDEPVNYCDLRHEPDSISVVSEAGTLKLRREKAGTWRNGEVVVTTTKSGACLDVQLTAPNTAVKYIEVRWNRISSPDWKYLGDAWERAYGDLEWEPLDEQRVMPWYFLSSDGRLTHGYGAKTGASSLCYWTAGQTNLTLHADVRCGGLGVQLGKRKLDVCRVVSRCGHRNESPFAAACGLCEQMCNHPRLPREPVYGFNDWYCTYGRDTADKFLKDVAMMVSLAPKGKYRPYAIVDDGWERPGTGSDPWRGVNPEFSRTMTMAALAKSIQAEGARPGLWFRPLLANSNQPADWRLSRDTNILDPSVPAVRAYVKQTVRQFRNWGFQIIKHDYTTYDLLGRWGFEMGGLPTTNGWSFADRSRTTAEIIRGLYQDIRDAAGDDTVVLGCNTIGHLSAGIFEIQRIGDDTSGRDWKRTREMGINSLAFRAPQQGRFFAVDADCVGQVTTNSIPWEKNRQWLDLLARSGTTLFMSFAHDATTENQRTDLSRAMARAAEVQPPGEPLDWMTRRTPQQWRLDGRKFEFSW